VLQDKRRTILLAWGIFLLTAGVPLPVCSEIPPQSDEESDSRVVIYSETDRETYRLDEIIRYRIIVAWKGEKFDVNYRIPKPSLENLILTNVTQKGEKQLTGSLIIQKRILTYHLRPEKTGGAFVKSFSFEYSRPDKETIQKAAIPNTNFEIIPAKKSIRRIIFELIPFAGAFIAFLLLTLFLLRKKKPAPPPRKLSISGLEDHYILELSRIEPLLTENKTRELVGKSGALFREYLQTKYQLVSQRFTNLELVSQIERRRDILQEERKQCTAILEYLNETQFGGLPPTQEEAAKLYNQVNDFIIGKKVVG